MTIPKKILEKWTELRSSGDVANISKASGINRQTIYYAFNNGKCSDETFEAIAKYYAEKEQRLSTFIKN
jgi:AcrR family transcriptional regulator